MILLVAVQVPAAASETPYLLLDMAPEPIPRSAPAARALVEMGDVFFFVATDGLHGYELWRSDGSLAGTRMVRDLCSGLCSSMPESLLAVEDRLYFVAWTPEAGRELWSSDGTPAGTVRLDVRPGPDGSSPSTLTAADDLLLFLVRDSEGSSELWRSDGTASGTWRVRVFDQGMSPWRFGESVGDSGAFILRVGSDFELWASDGTVAGTRRLASAPFPHAMRDLRATTDRLFFRIRKSSSDYELWSSDGTASGTQLALSSRFQPNRFEPYGNLLLFVRNGYIWSSDGTAQGTGVWLRPNCSPDALSSSDVGLFFSCSDGLGLEPWFSDGTASGTRRLADTVPGSAGGLTASSRFLASPGGALFAAPKPGAPEEFVLWFSDGTVAGTQAVQGTESLSWFSEGVRLPKPTSAGFLVRSGESSHAEYVVVDAQGNPTTLLGALNTQSSSFASGFATLPAGRTFFQTQRSISFSPRVNANWTFDGVAAAPFDLDASNGEIEPIWVPSFEQVEDRVFVLAGDPGLVWCPFGGNDPNHLLYLRSLGLDLSDVQPAPLSGSYWLTSFERTLYTRRFTSCNSSQAEVTFFEPESGLTGSVVGPSPVLTPPSPRNDWLDAGDRLYVPSQEGIWSVSPSNDAADRLSEALEADSFALASDGTVFVSAETSGEGREVWSLPAPGGARLLSVRPGSTSGVFRPPLQNPDPLFHSSLYFERASDEAAIRPPDFAVLDDHYFFVADDGLSGVELWSSSATGPPALVADLAPGAASSFPNNLLVAGGRLYFRADDGVHGSELWTVDGPGSAPVMLGDLQPGSGSSVPQQFADVGGELLFSADDGVHGRELWVSDGTPAGTRLAADIAVGPASSSPSGFLVESTRVLFSANDGLRGFEMWALDRPLAGPGGIFRSGFESGDSSSWAAEVP